MPSCLHMAMQHLIGGLGIGGANDVAVAVLGRVPARRVRRLGQNGQVRHVAEEGGKLNTLFINETDGEQFMCIS